MAYLIVKLRGCLIRNTCNVLESWSPGQPLIMMREPTNPVDTNAILMLDLKGRFGAYMGKEFAALLAPRMDAGEVWLARFRSPCQMPFKNATAVVWKLEDPPKAEEETAGDKLKRKKVEKEQLLS